VAFDWFKRKALPVGSSGLILLTGESGSIPAKVEDYVKEGFSENPVVNACISKIAEAAASVELELHTKKDDGETEVAVTGDVLDLLARPNPVQSWEEFIQELIAWRCVAGEAFILRLPEKGQPKELYLLNPAHVEVAKGTGLVPKAYVYGSGETKKTYPVNVITGVSQVLHLKRLNLSDPWRGLSQLTPCARAVDIHNNGARWNGSLLHNGARPSGVIEMQGTVDESTLSALREYFKKVWQGVKNAGNVPLLTGGAKFTALSHNPKDMDFEKNMSAAAKDIALALGVPLPLVTMEASTFSNMDAAQERLWMETVLPLLTVVIKKLSDFLMPLYNTGKSRTFLAFNADSVPALEPRRERLYKRMGTAVRDGLITVDLRPISPPVFRRVLDFQSGLMRPVFP
jgi:HK97 family phage portal protein